MCVCFSVCVCACVCVGGRGSYCRAAQYNMFISNSSRVRSLRDTETQEGLENEGAEERGREKEGERKKREERRASKQMSGSDGISTPPQPKYLDCICCHLQPNLPVCNMHEVKYQAMHTALSGRALYCVCLSQEPRAKSQDTRHQTPS